jgi:hypothetical protein
LRTRSCDALDNPAAQHKNGRGFSSTSPHGLCAFELEHQAVNMNDIDRSKSRILRGMAISATAIGAVAVGAFAIGAVAVGAFAIGALTIRRLAIRGVVGTSAKFKSLEIQDLAVKRLHAAEVIVTDSLKVPGSNANPRIS